MSEYPTTEQENEPMTTQSEIMMTQQQDTFIDDTAEFFSQQFEAAFDALIERRDDAYASAIATLDDEIQSLAVEYNAINDAARGAEELLPAREQVSHNEANVLLLEGKTEEARVKQTEAEQAAAAPGMMRDRQRAIQARVEEIKEEKEAVARRVVEEWLGECGKVTMACEHGFLVVLLDGLKQSLAAFKQRTGTASYDARFQGIGLRDLTADGDSEAWRSSRFWYKGLA
jgi:hypothetical protein